ncbi:MAG: hypothetical protein IT375_34985 [Polyangiaceae bacterium]|nr:hypothetical protein [Polyangiaceae bacterium]
MSNLRDATVRIPTPSLHGQLLRWVSVRIIANQSTADRVATKLAGRGGYLGRAAAGSTSCPKALGV